MGYVRGAVLEDVYDLAPNLREADKREVKSSSGFEPEYALFKAFQMSNHCYSIICNCKEDERTAGIFGVVRLNDMQGAVWMLASNLLVESKSHIKQFVRETKKYCDHLNQIYPVLFNMVDKRNEVHLRWLRWSGFTFLKEHIWGAEKLPFIEFVRIKNV